MCKDDYICNFYNEICKNIGNNYKVILEPNRTLSESWIEYDTVKWEMEEGVQNLVKELLNNTSLNLEEKIIKVYEFICLNYIYDANVLYFFRKDLSDINNIKYIAVDWYGRVVGPEWKEKRKVHNRRICYEFSRIYAKAINTLIDGKYELEAVMVGDIENTHYVVGLTGKDYSVILDQDDFNSIKDLTRLKLGLSIKGIHILRDDSLKMTKALEAYNYGRPDYLREIECAKENLKEKDIIDYFYTVVKIYSKYNIDPQGFFECVRTLIEEQGFHIEKIWKLDSKNEERRYERCLYFEHENTTYLLDSIEQTLKPINLDNLDKEKYIFNAEENLYSYYGG